MNLTKEQIEAVVQWMNTWSNLQQSSIPQMFREAFTTKDNTENSKEIKIGDRVRVKGDVSHPKMTVTRIFGRNLAEIGQSVYQAHREDVDLIECSYFIPDGQSSMRQYKFHKDALEKLIPAQAENKFESVAFSERAEVEKVLGKFVNAGAIEVMSSDLHKNSYTISIKKDLGLKPTCHTINSLGGAVSFGKWMGEMLLNKNIINWK